MTKASELNALVSRAAELLLDNGLHLVSAESCTGGWIAKCCTDLAGSSQWFERGFVTYSNEAKQDMLAVSSSTLKASGAVSEGVVKEMAIGALQHSRGDIAVAVSGIAGPGGGSKKKPVGTVWFAWASADRVVSRKVLFTGDRDAVRLKAVVVALQGVIDSFSKNSKIKLENK